jgi:hypothetical protein
MAEAVVVARAKQGEGEPEVAFQRRQPFDERALAPHLGEVAPAVDASETGHLRAEALWIGVTPSRLDGVLLLMVPMDQRQRRGQLRQEAVRPPLRDPARIAPHDDIAVYNIRHAHRVQLRLFQLHRAGQWRLPATTACCVATIR